MDSLNISTGEKRIQITRDGAHAGEIVFNPSDVLFAEKFYRLINEFQQTFAKYQARALELEKDKTKNNEGLPVNLGERIQLMHGACQFAFERIDVLFGAGTSAMVFGDTMLPEAIIQFFNGITPHVQKARAEKIAKYTNKRKRRNGKK